eukprot:822677-Prymnesium_polylepis.1
MASGSGHEGWSKRKGTRGHRLWIRAIYAPPPQMKSSFDSQRPRLPMGACMPLASSGVPTAQPLGCRKATTSSTSRSIASHDDADGGKPCARTQSKQRRMSAASNSARRAASRPLRTGQPSPSWDAVSAPPHRRWPCKSFCTRRQSVPLRACRPRGSAPTNPRARASARRWLANDSLPPAPRRAERRPSCATSPPTHHPAGPASTFAAPAYWVSLPTHSRAGPVHRASTFAA